MNLSPVETESGFQSGGQIDLDAESNHERFKDLVLPSSPSCLCVSIVSSDKGGDDEAGTQVVSDQARAEGRYRARKAWGQRAWREEKDRERASRAAQQVRRAAALTAELAAQSSSRYAAILQGCQMSHWLQSAHTSSTTDLRAVHLLWA